MGVCVYVCLFVCLSYLPVYMYVSLSDFLAGLEPDEMFENPNLCMQCHRLEVRLHRLAGTIPFMVLPILVVAHFPYPVLDYGLEIAHHLFNGS